jgi:polysaccharide biosynthesis protein PslH
MKILFVTQIFPYPPVSGGPIRSLNILKHLCKSHEVTLLSFIRAESELDNSRPLSSLCEVRTCKIRRSASRNAWFALQSLVKGSSFMIGRDWEPNMQRMLDELLQTQSFDLIYVDHLQMAQYVSAVKGIRKILDEHNVEWRIIERMSHFEGNLLKRAFARLEWRKLKKYELAACREFDAVFTVSEEDETTLESQGIDNVTTVPIGVDMDEFRKVDLNLNSKTILSLGTMSWPPNIDSMHYFCNEIYPLIKKKHRDVKLVIAGNNPPASIRALAAKDSSITVTGFVEDTRALASDCAAFIVPLRIGSGVRVKILNAMAMGLPIVTTSVGCEGMSVENGYNVVVADSPEEFAGAVNSLIELPDFRTNIAVHAQSLVLQKHAWHDILLTVDRTLASLFGSRVG